MFAYWVRSLRNHGYSSRFVGSPTNSSFRPSFSSIAFRRAPTANSPYPDLLYRDPKRPLPSIESLSHRRRWLRTIPVFILVLTCSALGIFNYQKVNSPIITATLYALRTNTNVRTMLGDEVYFDSKWAWIWGEINLVQGRVDVSFSVKGTKGSGLCRFRAHRVGGRSGPFKTSEWSLTSRDGQVLQLLDSSSRDPLAGATL